MRKPLISWQIVRGKKIFDISLRSICIATAATAAYAVIVWLGGSQTLCVYRNVFGIPCPGCGLTRALGLLIQGEPLRAFALHPLYPLTILCIATILFRSRKPFMQLYHKRAFWTCSIILLVGLWIVRMVIYFPHHEPMTFHHQSIAEQLIKFMNNAMKFFFN
jgi:hypothetical protein